MDSTVNFDSDEEIGSLFEWSEDDLSTEPSASDSEAPLESTSNSEETVVLLSSEVSSELNSVTRVTMVTTASSSALSVNFSTPQKVELNIETSVNKRKLDDGDKPKETGKRTKQTETEGQQESSNKPPKAGADSKQTEKNIEKKK